MRDGIEDNNYLAPATEGTPTRPAWVRLGLPIAAIVLVSGGVATAIGLTMPKVYEAEAMVELITPEGLPADASIPVGSERVRVARSSAVASQAVSALDLPNDPAFLTDNPSLDNSELDAATLRQRATALVLRNMDTGIDEIGSFARIAYRSSDPMLAADVANALAAAFIPADAQQVASAAGGSNAELQALVDQIRAELDAAERAQLAGEAGEDGAAPGLPTPEVSATPEETAIVAPSINNDAFIAQERRALESQLSAVQSQLARVEADISAGVAGTDDPVIAQLRQSKADLEAEYQRITEQFRADYPAALDMRDQIELIDATLAREAVRLAEDRAAEAQQLRIQQTDLLARIEVLGLEAAASSRSGLNLDETQQDLFAKRELYDLLVARLAAEQVTATLPTTARIIDNAVPPTRPVVPDWRLLVAGAVLAALLLSSLVVWLDKRRQRRRALGYS